MTDLQAAAAGQLGSAAAPPALPDLFWDRGYAVSDSLLDSAALAFAKAGMDASHRAGRMLNGVKKHVRGAVGEYSPLGGEALLVRCREQIEAVVGRPLQPAYAFWRIYMNGAELIRHLDRSACEVSATLSIFSEPAHDPWPIHLRDLHGTDVAVPLLPGQAVIYQGCRVPHWREKFGGVRQFQLFLHYVIKDGQQAAHAFDGRDGPVVKLPRP